MPDFTVRVELRGNPPFERYEKLHALMKKKGFNQTVNGSNGSHALPHATYYGWSSDSCGKVRDVVKADIKAQIQDDIIIFVAQTETWSIGW